eukprot:349821-Chlamydomonas_euryale.AAC.3
MQGRARLPIRTMSACGVFIQASKCKTILNNPRPHPATPGPPHPATPGPPHPATPGPPHPATPGPPHPATPGPPHPGTHLSLDHLTRLCWFGPLLLLCSSATISDSSCEQKLLISPAFLPPQRSSPHGRRSIELVPARPSPNN